MNPADLHNSISRSIFFIFFSFSSLFSEGPDSEIHWILVPSRTSAMPASTPPQRCPSSFTFIHFPSERKEHRKRPGSSSYIVKPSFTSSQSCKHSLTERMSPYKKSPFNHFPIHDHKAAWLSTALCTFEKRYPRFCRSYTVSLCIVCITYS